MLRSDWRELSEAYGQKRRKDRLELQKYRTDWERLRSLIPVPGEILKPSEIRERFEAIRKLVRK